MSPPTGVNNLPIKKRDDAIEIPTGDVEEATPLDPVALREDLKKAPWGDVTFGGNHVAGFPLCASFVDGGGAQCKQGFRGHGFLEVVGDPHAEAFDAVFWFGLPRNHDDGDFGCFVIAF